MPTAGETTALGYDAEAEGGDPRAKQKLAFTAEFVENLLADITDKVLEEPSQLEQVRLSPHAACHQGTGSSRGAGRTTTHATLPHASL
jgi:hypothetical protein